uniref:ATP synthase F0 subunit 8 n=1 Tax=Virpazaria ripkeni TaxID=2939667 RepID=UPI0020291DA8|nr:ATP synthase F0 subunit 8 [Virpazaria ripkeni]UPV69727.1 ATP synthase F0 subunit 8 [Virpazaria ripkeni]UPV69740.1 ATP synthase F0 subunit 8 [Virpazaria ripkeni]
MLPQLSPASGVTMLIFLISCILMLSISMNGCSSNANMSSGNKKFLGFILLK